MKILKYEIGADIKDYPVGTIVTGVPTFHPNFLNVFMYCKKFVTREDKFPNWVKQVYDIFPVLKEREGQLARTLSGGEQQMLAMGRGLMSRPKMCIIDEPSNGLAPRLVVEVFQIIKSLRDQGITILLVEQNVRQTLEIADRACVLENGRLVLEGLCNQLLQSDHVRKAYLGL